MATEANMPGFKQAGELTWNFHWAGVVMKDGADNLTLENFAVTEETAKDAGVAQGKYIDRDWNFEKGQPATQFYGHAQIELPGKATDYDPSAWDGALAIVRIGTDKRSEDELARLADQPVSVEGRLVLHPPIADPEVASPTPGPTLFDVGAITPR